MASTTNQLQHGLEPALIEKSRDLTFSPAAQFRDSGIYHHLAETRYPAICDFIPGFAFFCFIGRRLAEQLIDLFD